jgi:formate-dependent nitrite reductase membrane component NrfD
MNPFVADPDWGIWIILYFYLGGIAAGAYFLATLVALFGHEQDRAVSRIGYRLALPLISVCGVLLIVDLERPERFWHMMLQSEVVEAALAEGWPAGGWDTMIYAPMLKHWSPMSIGAWALALFGLCSTLSFVGTLWPGGRLERWLMRGIFGKVLLFAGSAVGFFIGSYTGVLLTASNQPLWSLSDWIGPLFLTSAASTGIATVLLLACWRNALAAETLDRLERADLWAMGLELAVFLIFLASLQGMLPLALRTLAGWLLVLGTLGVGLLVPLWLHLAGGPRRPMTAAACALIGGLALRVGVLQTAPVLIGGDLPGPAWHSVAGWGLVIVVVALGMGLPWLLWRRVRFTGKQTVLAGLASLLVYAAILSFFARPATGWPMLERLALPGFSSEEGRQRGGGPGASELNRPAETQLRSKITGSLPDEP